MAIRKQPGDLVMSDSRFELECDRELLSRAIVDVLGGWPDLHRRVFVEAHYEGRSIETISRSLGVCATDVRMILEGCERRLRAALRSFIGAGHRSSEHPRPGVAVRSASRNFS